MIRRVFPCHSLAVRLCLSVGGMLVATSFVAGQPSPARTDAPLANADSLPSAEDLEGLVRQLGSNQFRYREQAMLRLAEIGTPALPYLKKGSESGDPEVAQRATFLYDRLLNNDLENRLAQFTAGKTDGDNLDGWSYFQRHFDDSPILRQLFAEAYQSFPNLIAALEPGKAAAPAIREQQDLLITAVERLQHKQRTELERATEAELLAVLAPFLDGDVQVTTNANLTLRSFVGTAPFTTAIHEEGKREIFEKLGSAWIRNAPPDTWYDSLAFAMQNGLQGGYDLSKRILSSDNVDKEIVQYAMLCLGRFGSQGDVAHLRPFFDDDRLIREHETFREPRSLKDPSQSEGRGLHLQVRDTALAVAIRLAGGDVGDAGFPEIQAHPRYFFLPSGIGFYGGEDAPRDAARKYLEERLDSQTDS